MRSLARSALTIASAAYRESMRQPAAVVTLLAATSIIVLSPNLGVFDLGEEYKIAIDTSLATVLLAGLFTVLFAASQTVSAELQSRTALTLLAKPVSWELFLIGKFLGVAAAGLTAVLILAMPLLVMTRLSAEPTTEHSIFIEPQAAQGAEVSALEPSKSFGRREKLRVSGPPDERMVFLLFDTERAAQHEITNVVLRLRWLGPEEAQDPSATRRPKGVTVHHVPDTLWSAQALTWASRPALGKRIARLPEPDPTRIYEVPASRYALGRRMIAFALRSPQGMNAYFGGTSAPLNRRTGLEIRHRAAADPARWLIVLGALLLWPGLALALARNPRRSAYAATAWSYATACLAVLVFLSAMVGWEKFKIDLRLFEITVPSVRTKGPLALLGVPVAGWDWPILQGLLLSGMEILVLAAVGVAIAARAGRVWTFLLTFLVFTLGHMAAGWASGLARGAPSAWQATVVSVLPNLEHFNLSDRVAHGEVLPAGLVGSAALYMLLYAMAALLVGMALIRGRELN